VAVIIGVGLVIAALFFNPFSGKSDSKAEPGQAAALLEKKTEPKVEEQEEPQEQNPGVEISGQVTVRFNSVPDNVQIKVGDEVFEGNAISLDKSTEPVKIILQAEGYTQREVTIVPLANLELSGQLEPLPSVAEMAVASAKKTGKPKGKKGGKPKTGTETKTQPAVEDTKKTSKGMDFIRDYPGKK
jgi:hypothetical protein